MRLEGIWNTLCQRAQAGLMPQVAVMQQFMLILQLAQRMEHYGPELMRFVVKGVFGSVPALEPVVLSMLGL
jgi:hypothetical protein